VGKRAKARRGDATERIPAGPVATAPRLTAGDGRLAGLLAVLIVVAIFVVYGRALSQPFTNFDDPEYIVENSHVATGFSPGNAAWAFTHVHASNWHPLTWISHMLDVSLFGLDAGKHKLVSILLHAASSVLLLYFLRRATGRTWPSAAVAALFALHPTHVESVAWASERKDTLSMLFFVLTLSFYLDWTRSRRGRSYFFTLAAFALGLMCKPMLITLPFVLLLLDWWPLQRMTPAHPANNLPLLVEKLPLFALIVPSAIVTMNAQEQAMRALPFGVRLSNAVLSYLGYIGKTIWPANLAIIYPYRFATSSPEVLLGVVVLLAVTAAAVILARRFPYLLTGWLWFLGTLVPVIGLVQVGRQSMADRYTYIPTIGLFLSASWLLADVVSNKRAMIGATAAIVMGYAAVAFVQVGYWNDSVTLFSHAVAVTSNNSFARTTLARALLQEGDVDRAAGELRAAVAADESDDAAHNALGTTLSTLGDTAGAERELRRAMALNPRDAAYPRDLGDLLVATGRTAEAIPLFENSAKMNADPQTLAALAAARDQIDESIRWYRAATETKPSSAELHNNLAAMLARKGEDSEAVTEYRQALRLNSHQYDAQMNLGAILSRLDRNDEAIEHFAAAAKERPKSSEPHVYLALVHAQGHRFAQAISEVSAALAIDPAAANSQFTNAVHIPFKETNLADYREFLKSK
jgi:Tfp pilus assembly protein PilF